MNIPNLPFLQKKEEKEIFLALILRNEKAKAIIFEREGDNLKYINSAEEEFKTTLEDASLDEFLDALDKSISQAETILPKPEDKYQTILALKDNWIENDKIKKEYLDKLKKASDELALEPIGFLVFSESISNLLQKEEGAPVTAILAEIGKRFLTVFYIRSGKIMEARGSEIHQSASFTVDTLLKHLETPAVMPTRIILLDSEEDELTQEFINHQWSKSLNFLHIPQIISLPADSDVKAVLLGAATQMGTHLAFDTNSPIPEQNEEEPSVKPNDESEILGPEGIRKNKENQEIENIGYVSSNGSMDFFGFKSGDIAKDSPPNVKPDVDIPAKEIESVNEEIPEDVKLKAERKQGVSSLLVLAADKAKHTYPKILSLATNTFKNFQRGGFKDKRNILIIATVFVLLIIFYFVFVFQTKAKIDITVNTIDKSQTEDITFSPNSTTDFENSVIEATIVPVDETGSVTINVSGKKDVGTNAKGTVTIFNNDTDPVKFAAGTKITSSNGLEFTLDNAVSVASASGDVFSGTKPGTANVSVTSTEIGTEYNLPSDTKFTVGSVKTVGAKNDKAFSGGTKKNVQVVSAEDLAKARIELPKSLAEKAKADIFKKSQNGTIILPQFIDTDLSNEKFDKKLGDETSKVTLTATVSFNYISYSQSDLVSFAENIFQDQSFDILKSSVSTDVKKLTISKNRDVDVNLVLNVKEVPKIDSGNIINQVRGENIQKAKNLISNMENVDNVEISVSPGIPFLTNSLPKNTENIEVDVSNK